MVSLAMRRRFLAPALADVGIEAVITRELDQRAQRHAAGGTEALPILGASAALVCPARTVQATQPVRQARLPPVASWTAMPMSSHAERASDRPSLRMLARQSKATCSSRWRV